MFRFQARIELGFIADNPFTEPRHHPGKGYHRQAAHQVIKDVEVDHHLRFRQRQVIHQIRQRIDERQDGQATHQLKQQAAERHATGCGVGGAIIEYRQQAGAEVSANHQTQGHREGDDPRRGERGG